MSTFHPTTANVGQNVPKMSKTWDKTRVNHRNCTQTFFLSWSILYSAGSFHMCVYTTHKHIQMEMFSDIKRKQTTTTTDLMWSGRDIICSYITAGSDSRWADKKCCSFLLHTQSNENAFNLQIKANKHTNRQIITKQAGIYADAVKQRIYIFDQLGKRWTHLDMTTKQTSAKTIKTALPN